MQNDITSTQISIFLPTLPTGRYGRYFVMNQYVSWGRFRDNDMKMNSAAPYMTEINSRGR